MIVAGIILLLVGAAVVHFATDSTIRFLGLIAAGLGVLLILLAVLDVGVDNGGGDLDAAFLAPGLMWGWLRPRLRFV